MPQFDPSTFSTQIFWLVVTFITLYFILWKVVLPKISDVLETRQDKIEDDIDRAAKLKAEAEEVLAAYHKALDDARSEAQAQVKATADEMTAEAARRHGEFGAALAKQMGDAEGRIGKARDEALASIREIAAGTATAAVGRLTGVEVSEADAQAAVAEALEGRG